MVLSQSATPTTEAELHDSPSMWAELNGGENFLHWKAKFLPLFSIVIL